jgi:hypothetical protein
MSSAWESLLAATLVLASAGPMKQRLLEAYNAHLAQLSDEDLPRELRDDYGELARQMSYIRPLRGETAVQATVRKMSDAEAGTCAQRIVRMLATLARIQGQARPLLRAVNSSED